MQLEDLDKLHFFMIAMSVRFSAEAGTFCFRGELARPSLMVVAVYLRVAWIAPIISF